MLVNQMYFALGKTISVCRVNLCATWNHFERLADDEDRAHADEHGCQVALVFKAAAVDST